MKSKLIILGAGGLGREIAAMLMFSSLSNDYHFMGYLDDAIAAGTIVQGFPVLGKLNNLKDIAPDTALALAIGDPQTKEKLVSQVKETGLLHFPNLIHPAAKLHDIERITLGEGNIIGDGSILTTNIKMGSFNLVNLSCTIGHDVVMGNYCSLMPAVNISGGVHLAHKVYCGTGSQVINDLSIGENSIIGAGAVVIRNVPANCTAVGVPAKF